MMKLIFYWSKIEFKYQDETICFPSTKQVPLHGKFKTRKLLTCLDPQCRIVIQCQNIVYVLNGHDIVQPKLRVLKELTGRTDYNINDSQSDIVKELIHVQTGAVMLNEGACKLGQSDQIINNSQNQNENMIWSPKSKKYLNVPIAKIVFTCKRIVSCRNIYLYIY